MNDATAERGARRAPEALLQRLVSGVVLAALGLGIAYLGGPAFLVLVGLAGAAMVIEWHRLGGDRRAIPPVAYPALASLGAACALFATLGPLAALIAVCGGAALSAALARTLGGRALHGGLAALTIGLTLLGTLWLRGDDAAGRATIFWLLAVVWATDIGAYALGRALGGPRLAPRLSPGKTWAGAGGGLALALGASVLMGWLMVRLGWAPGAPGAALLIAAGALLSGLGQGGDLAESWLKRSFGAKHSGVLIPGHGGVLDRLDGYSFALLGLVLARLAAGGESLPWAWPG